MDRSDHRASVSRTPRGAAALAAALVWALCGADPAAHAEPRAARPSGEPEATMADLTETFDPRSIPSVRYLAEAGPPTGPSDVDPPDDGLSGPPPGVGPNLEVSDPQLPFPDGLIGRSETTMATALGGEMLVVGWNDAEGFCGRPFNVSCTPPPTPGFTGYGVSSDGGRTFDDRGAPFVGSRIGFGPGSAGTSATGRYVTAGDPSLDAGGPAGRRVYFANRAHFEDFAPYPGGISVHIGSIDGAGRFSFDDAVLLQSPGYPRDVVDKPHVAADPRSADARELVAVTLTNFVEFDGVIGAGLGQIEAFFSHDGGITWNRSVIQPDETRSFSPQRQGVINQGSEPVVAPDGSAYAVWQRGYLSPFFAQGSIGVWPQIRIARSDDGGATWTPAATHPPGTVDNPAGTLVAPICAGDVFPPSGFSRNQTNSWPRIAVARSGPHAGRLYVVWQDCRVANGGVMPAPLGSEDFVGMDLGHPDTDIFLAYSDDRGVTWSEPVRVAGGGDGLLQFFPTISVGPTGAVDVTYSESFEPQGTTFQGLGGGTSLVDVHWTRSVDGGDTFRAPVRVTEVTTDWAATFSNLNPNFGDYNDALTLGQRLYVTWADGRTGYPAVFFAEAKGSAGGDPE